MYSSYKKKLYKYLIFNAINFYFSLSRKKDRFVLLELRFALEL